MKETARQKKKRNGEKTRQRILSVASEVFASSGYDRTSVREVAKRAGISVGCVYLYFPNKQELYLKLMQEQVKEFLSGMEPVTQAPPAQALKMLIMEYMNVAVRKSRMLSMSIKEFDLDFRRPLRSEFVSAQLRIIAGILKRGIQEGTFRELDCNGNALMILSCLRGALLTYLTGEISSPQAFGEQLYTFILTGLRSEADAKKS